MTQSGVDEVKGKASHEYPELPGLWRSSAGLYISVLLQETVWRVTQAETLGSFAAGQVCITLAFCTGQKGGLMTAMSVFRGVFYRKINAYLTNGVCFVDLILQSTGLTMASN